MLVIYGRKADSRIAGVYCKFSYILLCVLYHVVLHRVHMKRITANMRLLEMT